MNQHPQYSDEELARAWIRRFSQHRASILSVEDVDARVHAEQVVDAETKWAFDELERLVGDDPARAWAVILCILSAAHQDQNALDNLSAGPLETLLARHGREVLNWVEDEAKANLRFRKLLQGVWRNAIDETVWERIQLLSRAATESEKP